MSEPRDKTKRRTLTVLAGATGCAALGLVGAPSLRLLVAAADSGEAASAPWTKVPWRLGDLEPDRPRRVVIAEGASRSSIWLVKSGGGVKAFAARCPHLGCSVGLAPDAGSFLCPCHQASFSLQGTRLARETNPSPRDMDPLELRVDDGGGELEVRLVRYLPGSAERVVVEGSWG